MVSFTILFILSKKLCGTALIYFFAPAVYGSASLALQLFFTWRSWRLSGSLTTDR